MSIREEKMSSVRLLSRFPLAVKAEASVDSGWPGQVL